MTSDFVTRDNGLRSSQPSSLIADGPCADVDWSTATVKVAVKVYGTSGETTQEIDLPLTALASLVVSNAPTQFDTWHSWPVCPKCDRPHDSNGIECPPWTPPQSMGSTPHRVACGTCDREQFVWTDGRSYFCGYCGTDLGLIVATVTT